MGLLTETIRVRLELNDQMRVSELAREMQTDVSTVIRAGVKKLLDEAYDCDGYLKHETQERHESGEP